MINQLQIYFKKTDPLLYTAAQKSMELQLKRTDRQCALSTGVLNTEDNNWELGQTDWFVGRQLADCNGFQAQCCGSGSGSTSTLELFGPVRVRIRIWNILLNPSFMTSQSVDKIRQYLHSFLKHAQKNLFKFQ
jgi:hypothetical protein